MVQCMITEISTKTKTYTETVKTLKVDQFVVTEVYLNTTLTKQIWSVDGGFNTTHPEAYEPKKLYFSYYDDISFLDSDFVCNSHEFYYTMPESELITDWDKFKGLEHMLCVHLGSDGNIYRINDHVPIPLWRSQGYIGGFHSAEYDLNLVVDILKSFDFIRNITTVDVPWYNRSYDTERAVIFDYKLSSSKELGKILKTEKLFAKHYFS
jgi:hypothetical protein